MTIKITQWHATLALYGFVPITSINRQKFQPYQSYTAFDDLSYSLLCAWSFRYLYMCKIIFGNMVIVGHDIEDGLFFAVLPVDYETLNNTSNVFMAVV